jgi:uncharacterized protein DUF6325
VNDNDYEIGPVDYLIVMWPAGSAPNGEGLSHLGELSERGLIRVLDLAFVRKEQDGTMTGLALTDIDHDGSLDLVQFQADSALLGQEDYDEAGAALDPGASAAILIYENTWAAPFVTAVRKTGAEVIASGRIPADDVLQALEEVETAEV